MDLEHFNGLCLETALFLKPTNTVNVISKQTQCQLVLEYTVSSKLFVVLFTWTKFQIEQNQIQ